MMYSFNTKYNKNTTNIFKILLDDGIKTKIVFISLYLIKASVNSLYAYA